MKIKPKHQISESIELGILLAIIGGFMDVYSYKARGKVFANAQTGNILLCGIYISEGNFTKSIQYFFPVFAFTLGIIISNILYQKNIKKLHWRQISVFIECIILIIVAFIPVKFNFLANTLTSFACGTQVESFRKIHGKAISTTMCIGNLRNATQSICQYFKLKKTEDLMCSLLYFGTIFCFVLGAIIGNIFIKTFNQYAILFNSLFLFIACLMMFIDRENND